MPRHDRPRSPLPALWTMLAFLALAACSFPNVGPDFATRAKTLDAATFECCFEPEKYYPEILARVALAVGNDVGPQASEIAYGEYQDSEYPGALTGKTDAHAAIVATLRPLDILLVSNTSYPLGRLMPGRFSHALMYVGTEAQLRAAGYWNLPEVKPHHADIRAGKTMIESATPDVHLLTPAKAFERDRVLAVRPELNRAERVQAMRGLFSVMGKPFNFGLNLDPNQEYFVCTGLVDRAVPGVELVRRVAYGETVILPDDIAAQAIRGEGLEVVNYVVGTDDGYTRRSTYALMVDIAAYWGIPDGD